MDSRLAAYIAPWEEPIWEDTLELSIAALREHAADINPKRMSRQVLATVVEGYVRDVLIRNEFVLDKGQLRIVASGVSRRGWDGVFFQCPHTGASVQTIYYVDGGLVARSSLREPVVRQAFRDRYFRAALLRLLGDPWSLPPEVLNAAIAELSAFDGADEPDVRVTLEFAQSVSLCKSARLGVAASHLKRGMEDAASERRRRRLAKAKLKADPLCITAALRRAERAGKASLQESTQGLSLDPDEDVEVLDRLILAPLSWPPAPLRDHLHIDLRALSQEPRYWRPGEFTEFALSEGVLIGVDLRPKTPPQVSFSFRVADRAWLQCVSLELTAIGGRVRPRFVCSIDGPREVLAFREGRFASVRAQRLLFPSEVARRGSNPSKRRKSPAKLP